MAHVLVVDDDQTIRETVAALLEDDGHWVETAGDGMDAVEILRTTPEPLVVVLDVWMPRMGGDEVLRLVDEGDSLLTRHAFIMMSAFHNLPEGLPVLRARLGVPLVTKPFSIDVMLAAVDAAAARLHVQVRT